MYLIPKISQLKESNESLQDENDALKSQNEELYHGNESFTALSSSFDKVNTLRLDLEASLDLQKESSMMLEDENTKLSEKVEEYQCKLESVEEEKKKRTEKEKDQKKIQREQQDIINHLKDRVRDLESELATTKAINATFEDEKQNEESAPPLFKRETILAESNDFEDSPPTHSPALGMAVSEQFEMTTFDNEVPSPPPVHDRSNSIEPFGPLIDEPNGDYLSDNAISNVNALHRMSLLATKASRSAVLLESFDMDAIDEVLHEKEKEFALRLKEQKEEFEKSMKKVMKKSQQKVHKLESKLKKLEKKSDEKRRRLETENSRLKERLKNSWEFCVTPSWFSNSIEDDD